MNKDHTFYTRRRRPLNIDITFNCALECLRCGRQMEFRRNGKKVPGYHLSLEEFDKVTNHFHGISFCGQYSDPLHHPQFIDFLKMCRLKNIYAEIHVASTARPEEYFIEAFQANPKATWIFGIDGLPEQSHHYRVNQDGVKLYNIMLKAREYLIDKPRWQYILFKYNQDNVDKAMEMAKTEGLWVEFIQSARWDRELETDPLKPTVLR